ncbi:MAG: hypothetical protein JNL79_37140 [Myxococcales bacterium]|nr:hypothetical protein [Myxococcales bacterium]
MSETTRSQLHNPFVAAFESHLARTEAFYAQAATLEQKALEQAQTQLDESARLSRETLAYGAAMMAEWRKASLEMARRTAQLFTVA